MAVFSRVAPWILFGLGQLLFGREWASPLGAVAAAVIIGVGLARGHKPAEMILDASSLTYFTGFSGLVFAAPQSAIIEYVAGGAQLFQAAVIGVFLLARLPFTLPIARHSVPDAIGNSDWFYAFNARLTLVWLIAFVAGGAAIVLMVLAGFDNVPAQIVVIIVSIILPAYVQNRIVHKAEASISV
ncbi:hypothetical protein [Spelaeicoccus albus]|uniref:Uncharacterized protein n=1 Tax=Spelaeicoccus albus TaxID=1280376 RepID=A0A7Z0D198_9MICO|nr:hypothetical protein [Spelaeicoccus albus]NYI66638.1 hypothetical protein [Spelaeicoccus albus]